MEGLMKIELLHVVVYLDTINWKLIDIGTDTRILKHMANIYVFRQFLQT